MPEPVKEGLREIRDQITGIEDIDTPIVKQAMFSLERLLLKNAFDDAEEKEALAAFHKDLPVFQHAYEVFENTLEFEFDARLLADASVRLEDYYMYERFVTLIKNEIKLAGITKNDHLLFIGSGPLPISPILSHRLAGCRVDCFERREHAAARSRVLLEKMGLSNAIKVHTQEGQSLNKNNYTVAVIALLAKPKKDIIQKAWEHAVPKERIICRTADGIRQLFYETTDPDLLQSYNPVEKVFAKGDQTISSVLLEK